MRTLGTRLADDVMTCKRNSAMNISFDFCFHFVSFLFSFLRFLSLALTIIITSRLKFCLLPTSQAFWKTRRPDEAADYRAVRRFVCAEKISQTLQNVEM